MGTTLLATDIVVRTSTGEAVAFWILGVIAIVGGIGVVSAAKAVYSALFLAMTMLILAVFYFVRTRCSSAWCRSSSTPAR